MSHREWPSDPLELLRRANDSSPPTGAQERVAAMLLASSSSAALASSSLASSLAEGSRGVVSRLARRFLGWSVVPLAAGIAIGAGGQALVDRGRQREQPGASTVLPPVAGATASGASGDVASATNSGVSSDASADAVPPPLAVTEPHREPVALAASANLRTADALAQERAILDRARKKIALGEAEGALKLLEEHAARHRRGALVEEREAMLVNVLVSLGRSEEAVTRGEAFQNRFPGSLMLPSVKAALAANRK